MSAKRFEDLEVWQAGRDLVRAVYRATETGSFAKDFGLRDQCRRAAVSVCSNIAEGFERDGDREFMQFLSVAKGSAGEVRSQLHNAADAGHLTQTQFSELYNSCLRLSAKLSNFMTYLRENRLGGRKYRTHSPEAPETPETPETN